MDWFEIICGACAILTSFLFFVGVVLVFELKKYISK